MIIHRSAPESRFTIIPDDTLRDATLSYLARGVLAEILSRPDDWSTNADAIAARAQRDRSKAGEGRRAVRAAFAELAASRYLFRLKRRDQLGHVVTDLHIFDTPQECLPDGTPVYFSALATLTGIPDGGKSVPPAETRIVAGRTDVPLTGIPVTGTPATGTPASGTSLRRPTTETITETLNGNRHDRDIKGPAVSSSVEGSNGAAVKTGIYISDEQNLADRTGLAHLSGERQSQLLDAAKRQLPANPTTREIVHVAARLAGASAP